MKLNFATLFNINYLAKGIALHTSLLETCPDFHLYIFAFDDISYNILIERRLAHTTIISLTEFENEPLKGVKSHRTAAEYCWTSTPFTIKYCIENFALDHCTYIDADLYFYNDPSDLVKGMGSNSVLITPHNYYTPFDQTGISGIYCVQFVTFKNTRDGLTVLNWWASACIAWCYARYEDGKMGDQKYLDSWPYMFNGVYICRSPGAGLAPWNTLKFEFRMNNGKLEVDHTPLYFYHFHGLMHYSNGTWGLGGYPIAEDILKPIYKPYVNSLLTIANEVKHKYNRDCLSIKDIKSVSAFSWKYKIGIYVMDLKKSFRKFTADLIFADRKKAIKDNYIKFN